MANYFSDQEALGGAHGWHVYVVAEEGDEFSKIGTALTLDYRLAGLRNGNPRPLRIAASWRLDSREAAFAVEKTALLALESRRLPARDWVRCSERDAIRAVTGALLKVGAKLRDVA